MDRKNQSVHRKGVDPKKLPMSDGRPSPLGRSSRDTARRLVSPPRDTKADSEDRRDGRLMGSMSPRRNPSQSKKDTISGQDEGNMMQRPPIQLAGGSHPLPFVPQVTYNSRIRAPGPQESTAQRHPGVSSRISPEEHPPIRRQPSGPIRDTLGTRFQEPVHTQRHFSYAVQELGGLSGNGTGTPTTIGDRFTHHPTDRGAMNLRTQEKGNDFNKFVRVLHEHPAFNMIGDQIQGNRKPAGAHQAAWNRCFEVGIAAQQHGLRHAAETFGPVDMFMSAFYDVCTRISHDPNYHRDQAASPPQMVHPASMNVQTDTVTVSANRAKLSTHAKETLETWFQKNFESPYPTAVEKRELSEKAGLNRMQINNWFANRRQRLKRKHLQDDTVLAPRAKWRRLMAASQAPEPVESRIDPHTIGGQRPGLQAPTMFNLSATQGGSLNISNARDPPVRKYPQTTNAPSGSVSRPPTKSPHPPRKS